MTAARFPHRRRLAAVTLPLVLSMAALLPPTALVAGTSNSPSAPLPQPTCKGVDGHAAAFGGRRTFFLAPDIMSGLKAEATSDPATAAALKSLLSRADAALKRGPYTVVDKRTIPPSGDRHDYLSVGPYWWPDPSKPNGLPYMRRDGEINPDRSSNKYDLADLEAMSADIELLGLAYYFTDDPKYAAHAAKLLRVWFLAPETRMNPNMDFGQAVPGRENGRAEGIIDTARLQRVVESIGLIGPADVLSPADQAGLEKWFGDYVDWMRKSPNGKDEDSAKNNHAIWFDSQIMQFALFARRPEVAKKVAEAFGKRRLSAQMTVDGKLPLELARTRSLHYSIFALAAAFDVAELAQCVDVDLWSWSDAKGRSLRKGVDFLAPYAGKVESWPMKELRPEREPLDELLRRAARAWPDAGYPVAPGTLQRRFMKGAPDPAL